MVEYISIALLLVLIVSVWIFGRKLLTPTEPPPPDPRLDEVLNTLENHRRLIDKLTELPGGVNDLRDKLVAGGEQRKSMKEYLAETRQTIDDLSRRLGMVTQAGDKNAQLLERLHAALLGASSRGQQGENLLREQLAVFPPSILATNYRFGTKVVEFALRLPDDRVVPIDSKWPEPQMLERLEAAESAEEQAKYKKDIEKKVVKMVSELKKYIDPEQTSPLAVAAIPDSVYTLVGGIHYQAYRQGVLLVSYSNAVPFLMAMYGLFLRYAQSLDTDRIKGHLGSLETLLTELDSILDNHLSRGGKMIANATDQCRDIALRMRKSLVAVTADKSSDAEPEQTEPNLFANEER